MAKPNELPFMTLKHLATHHLAKYFKGKLPETEVAAIEGDIQIQGRNVVRVGEDAVNAMQKVFQNVMAKLIENAAQFMEHAERRTLKRPDIEMAAKIMRLDFDADTS